LSLVTSLSDTASFEVDWRNWPQAQPNQEKRYCDCRFQMPACLSVRPSIYID